jgi:hypothetical protein
VLTGTLDRLQAVTGGTAIFTIVADHVVAPELRLHIYIVWEGGAATINVGSPKWSLHGLSFPKCGIASFGKAAKAGLLKIKKPPISPANKRYELVFIYALLVG